MKGFLKSIVREREGVPDGYYDIVTCMKKSYFAFTME